METFCCKGEKCPIKKICLRYVRGIGNTVDGFIRYCRNATMFINKDFVTEECEYSDEQLEQMSKDEANKLSAREKDRWVRLQNKTANLYHLNNGVIKDVSPEGWYK